MNRSFTVLFLKWKSFENLVSERTFDCAQTDDLRV